MVTLVFFLDRTYYSLISEPQAQLISHISDGTPHANRWPHANRVSEASVLPTSHVCQSRSKRDKEYWYVHLSISCIARGPCVAFVHAASVSRAR
jgi:hypothetical protein